MRSRDQIILLSGAMEGTAFMAAAQLEEFLRLTRFSPYPQRLVAPEGRQTSFPADSIKEHLVCGVPLAAPQPACSVSGGPLFQNPVPNPPYRKAALGEHARHRADTMIQLKAAEAIAS
jgi:hypothetical protein